MPADLAKLNVSTLATPKTGLLALARDLIAGDPEVRSIFVEARQNARPADWVAERLNAEVGRKWPMEDEAEIAAVSRYLADEFEQVGDATLLVDRATGKPIMRLGEADLYTPAPLPREEAGSLAQPLRRLNPNLEAALVTHTHDTAREGNLVLAAQAAFPVAVEATSPRLSVLSRPGRRAAEERLNGLLPSLIPDVIKGATRLFWEMIALCPWAADLGGPTFDGTAEAKWDYRSADKKALNLNVNIEAVMHRQIAYGWTRQIAADLARRAQSTLHHRISEPIRLDDLKVSHLSRAMIWVAPPDVAIKLESLRGSAQVVLAPHGTPVMGFEGMAATFAFDPDGYHVASLDQFDRWQATATCRYRMAVDWDAVRILNVTDVRVSGVSVEG